MPEEQVRAIFTWITHNIRYDERQAKRPQEAKPIEFRSQAELEQARQARLQEKLDRMLRKKKGVCQDYAWLFEAMLAEIGIEAAFISGYSRTFPEQMGRVPQTPRHAWSAAKIDGEWQLFDLTWSTDMEELGSDGFFMMAPEDFLKSHYPTEEKWQLMEPAVSLEEWSEREFWHKSYHRYKIGPLQVDGKPHEHHIMPYEGELSLPIELQPGQKLYAVKGEKRVELAKAGDAWTLNFEDNRLRGTVTIVVVEDGIFRQLLTFKVRS